MLADDADERGVRQLVGSVDRVLSELTRTRDVTRERRREANAGSRERLRCGSASTSSGRATSTVRPAEAAATFADSQSVVFPIPASPRKTTTALVSSPRTACADRNSSSRPTMPVSAAPTDR